MKYIVQVEIDPHRGAELEAKPGRIQGMMAKWQALEPLGMYFSLTRRSITIILDVESEDAFFEPLHKTWQETGSYPDVSPVVDVEEFPKLLARVGIG